MSKIMCHVLLLSTLCYKLSSCSAFKEPQIPKQDQDNVVKVLENPTKYAQAIHKNHTTFKHACLNEMKDNNAPFNPLYPPVKTLSATHFINCIDTGNYYHDHYTNIKRKKFEDLVVSAVSRYLEKHTSVAIFCLNDMNLLSHFSLLYRLIKKNPQVHVYFESIGQVSTDQSPQATSALYAYHEAIAGFKKYIAVTFPKAHLEYINSPNIGTCLYQLHKNTSVTPHFIIGTHTQAFQEIVEMFRTKYPDFEAIAL